MITPRHFKPFPIHRFQKYNIIKLFFFLIIVLNSFNASSQKVVLQGFWWNYWNNNYSNGWSDYLADLAPRLKQMGIDDVWVPPSIKNGNQGCGYSPFDD